MLKLSICQISPGTKHAFYFNKYFIKNSQVYFGLILNKRKCFEWNTKFYDGFVQFETYIIIQKMDVYFMAIDLSK